MRAESQEEWRERGIDEGNRQGREDKKTQVPHFTVSHKVDHQSAVWFFVVWYPVGNPSIQGAVSANEVCCKVKTGLLPQIRKGVRGMPAFQESPNSDFLSR